MLLPNRHGNSSDYRYGFNGKEMDNEVKGIGVQYDYGYRIYDVRLGKFLSQDPLMKEYPFLTPYQFASNTPIMAIDLDGLEMKISNTEASCVDTSSKTARLSFETDVHIHFKVLNTTGVKLEGFEKVTYDIKTRTAKTFSDKSGTATFSSMMDNQGNSFSNPVEIEMQGKLKRVSVSYQQISSLEQIKNDDYVLILTNKKLDQVGGREPRAYVEGTEGNVTVVNVENFVKKNRNGIYDFNANKKNSTLAKVINHENGHVFGLGDEYDHDTGIPKSGFEKNLMGNSSFQYLNKKQIGEILEGLFFQLAWDAIGTIKPTDTKKDVQKELDHNNISLQKK